MEKVHFIEIDQLTYGISIKESENKLTVFLTNFLHDFWISDVDKNDLPTISKEANSLISLSDKDTIIKQVLEKGETYLILESTPDSLKINVKYMIQNYPYNFHWKLKRCSPEAFQKFFTNPLLTILISQKQQIENLIDTVKAKDIEIQQYKLNGATLIREQLATEEFNEQHFIERWAVSDADGFGKMLLDGAACSKLKVALKIKKSIGKEVTASNSSTSYIKSPSKSRNKMNRPRDRIIMNQQKEDTKITYASSEELIKINDISEETVANVASVSAKANLQTSIQPVRKKSKFCIRPLDF